jgi:deoxyribodipyrimidine photo-lyase
MAAVVWFRRDLRLHDHPALRAALDRGERVVPVFCLDDRLLHGRNASAARTAFLMECLHDLSGELSARDACLVVRHGRPEAEIPALAAAVGAEEVHVCADHGTYGRHRDEAVRLALAAIGVDLLAHPGVSVVDDPVGVLTTASRPYSVFTPYYRRWRELPRRVPLAAPERIAVPGLPAAAGEGGLDGCPDGPMSAGPGPAGGPAGRAPGAAIGGEREGIRRLERFLAGPVRRYADERDRLAPPGSSGLSPYLRFGCLSARSVEAELPEGEGGEAFRRQLCWRDFFTQVLAHHPGNAREEFQPRYRHRLAWHDDEAAFAAWAQGRTGFPLVDAGMRQLRREGWMPGRVRLVAASFLTKDLGIDWRRGEAWFMRWLLDGDPAVNNGNWQWVACVGVDPAPPFRRLYNPSAHRDRYDPDGRYVREQIPELARVPDAYLSEPWRMPAQEQERAGCRIGRDYPPPIVDHRLAREEALARYRAAAGR